jgi:hypothetical protein
MTTLLEETVTLMEALPPDTTNVEDIIDAALITCREFNNADGVVEDASWLPVIEQAQRIWRLVEDSDIALELADLVEEERQLKLARLEEILSDFDKINALLHICPDVVHEALAIIEQEAENEEDNEIEASIHDEDLEDLDEARGGFRRYRRWNRVKSSDPRSIINSTQRTFRNVVNQNTAEFHRLTGGLSNESVADYELSEEEIALANETLRLSEGAQFALRNAMALKKKQKEDEAHQKHLQTLADIRDRAGLRRQDEALTPAQKSIQAHGTPSAQAIAAMLPKSWTTSDEPPAFSLNDIEVRAALPDEFKPKMSKTDDRSFHAMAGRLKNAGAAAKTIERPVASKDVGKGNDDQNDKSYLSPNRTPADDASGVSGADTYKPAYKDATRQQQYDVDLRNLVSVRSQDIPPKTNR